MGADARPSRTCKMKTIERLSLQCEEVLAADDSESDFMRESMHTTRRRSKRLVHEEDEDDDDDEPLGTGTLHLSQSSLPKIEMVEKPVVQDDDPHHHKHSSDEEDAHYSDKEAETIIQQESKNILHISGSDDNLDDGEEEEEEDDDVDDPSFMSTEAKKSVPLRLPVSSRAAAFITKSGRISKPPQSVAPKIESIRHRDKSMPEQYPSMYSGRLRSRTRRLGATYVPDEKEIHDNYVGKQEPNNVPVSHPKRSGARLVSTEEFETRRRTRLSSRLNTVSNDDAGTNPYQTRNRSRRDAGTRDRSSRQRRNGLESEDEDDDGGDRDFQTPQSLEEESDDDAAAFMEETELERSRHEASDDEEIVASAGASRLRRNRKSQPQRSRPRKRKRDRTRADREQNALARETRKSYRPRRESLRPIDFYEDPNRSSDEDDSTDYSAPLPKRPRSTRAAASRAGDAIANDVSKLNFLQTPMALADAREPVRPKRLDRYSHKRNRMAPTRPDPFASDADDALGGVPSPIEPVQVDLDLSWDDIGGLDHHVRALKEMVFLPLLYPEVFEKFHMEPPKGVLFYGPPGTGKTLCARALAASCGADPVPSEDPVISDSKGLKSQPKDKQNEVETKTSSPIRQNGRIIEDEIIDGSGFHKHAAEPHVTVAQETTALPSNLIGVGQGGNLESTVQRDAVLKDVKSPKKETTSAVNISPKSLSSKKVKKKPRVAFFMRNGADCLSKWVGEAERHLRMTFEAAKRHQPSIIFFDEIDGLAPVRSSRQDQIHSSIVSTLLSLMDGLDARGKVVVIGATNRVDAIDPALRRPGRFDRELIFTLPNMDARRRILGIHTAKWSPPPNPKVLDAVASIAVGYCGADLKALCSEAAIRALRRRYPQIYRSHDKLKIDVNEVRVSTKDFVAAMKDIIPASHRSARTYARPISERLRAILSHPLQSCIYTLQRIFAPGLSSHGSCGKRTVENGKSPPQDDYDGYISSSSDEEGLLNIEALQDQIAIAGKERSSSARSALARHHILRPRLLICGQQGLGQSELGPALLHYCEGCPVHAIDYPSLQADGARSCEESLISAFREAARSVPSILYLPHMQLWWESASESLQTTLIIALKDIPSDLPMLVLATAEKQLQDLPQELTELFGEVVELGAPSEQHRRDLFAPLIQQAVAKPKRSDSVARLRKRKRAAEILPKAPPPPPREPTAEERAQKLRLEDRYIRMLRMEMRSFVEQLLRDRRFKAFWNPVDINSAPDYYEIIKEPMDISKIAALVDRGRYPTVLAMVRDFNVMVHNAINYNPPHTESGAMILRRAHGLIDIVHAWTDNLDPSLVETCNRIVAERIERAELERSKAEQGEKQPEEAQANETNGDLMENHRNEVLAGQTFHKVVEETKAGTDVMDVDMSGKATTLVRENGPMERVSILGVVDSAEEKFIEADDGKLGALQQLVVDVSTGMTVEGLEGLYVRCEKVLHERRRSMDRDGVVRSLIDTVRLARDDPALVGKLVE
eukprot:TRINITY_DN753_c0_g1_i1.p1 TRINITY_DN753_c0_g1~~TRINITY_DN753_c0_g1_i1.p1  ORF type:complete len:1500 (+),score=256.56 TRINITY_DN753_c0_g1_i1:3904-8403(+)